LASKGDGGLTPRATLTAEAIVNAALAFIDEQGLEQLSMRKLGARLGVEAMTLYHHVPSKEALLDRLVERVIIRADFLEADQTLGWRERLERFARRYRAILTERPNLVPLIATRPVRSPEAMRHLASGGAALMRAGFTLEQCFHIGNSLAMLVIGAALAEIGPASGAVLATSDGSPFAEAMNHPAEAVHDHDAIFDFALSCLLDGISSLRAPAL
jgi:TetR/AcrR family tetracycline transcriptional repressor